jgi:NAD+ kinase
MPFNPIALVGRHADARVAECMLTLVQHLEAGGVQVLADAAVVQSLGRPALQPAGEKEIVARARLVIAIGGDGTMLYAARLVAEHGIPLLGVNRGRLGFLTDVSPENMLQRLDEVLAGRFTEDPRTLLEATIARPSAPRASLTALNDVVLQKWATGRMLDFETWIDGRYVNSHGGDGLVVATATGSTAYALSCGGPIVQPDVGVLVMAPICPHTLSDRPIIVPAGSSVEVRLMQRQDTRAQVVCDGVLLGELEPTDRLLIAPSKHRVMLLHPPGYDYYRLLRSKLHWGRGTVDGPPGPASAPER